MSTERSLLLNALPLHNTHVAASNAPSHGPNNLLNAITANVTLVEGGESGYHTLREWSLFPVHGIFATSSRLATVTKQGRFGRCAAAFNPTSPRRSVWPIVASIRKTILDFLIVPSAVGPQRRMRQPPATAKNNISKAWDFHFSLSPTALP